jgi:phosphoribosylanthranilate isomerase
MMIKVCGITRREDAVAAAEAGASALGFIFYPESPRYVTPERAAELGDGLPVWKVGVFVDESRAAMQAAVQTAHLDVVQIYGPSDGLTTTPVWFAARVPDGGFWFEGEPGAVLLLDGAANGVAWDWPLARHFTEKYKVIVAGGLDASNVAQAIRAASPWGVDASSRLESAPGIKDHAKVRAFVKAAREAS